VEDTSTEWFGPGGDANTYSPFKIAPHGMSAWSTYCRSVRLSSPRAWNLREPFNAVFVDGKRWDYHDGRHVFLPNRRGMYRIAVRDGMPPRPRITRTWAALSRAELREDDSGLALELDVGHPEGRLDPHTVGLSYYLQIETFGWILGDVSGVVRVVPREELGLTPAQYAQPDNSLVVGVPNGPVTLRFKSASDDQRTVQ